MTKKQLEKHFKITLEKDLKTLGYSMDLMGFEKLEDNNLYCISIENNSVLYFDNFNNINGFLNFYIKEIKVFSLCKKTIVDTFKKSKNYIKSEHDEKNLKIYKEKIRQLIKVDKKIKITEIAKELGITRQAIYKNLELKKFIENLKTI